jgi:hypothetical protein
VRVWVRCRARRYRVVPVANLGQHESRSQDVTAEPLRLQLVLESDGDPIRGRLVLGTGETLTFVGWLELMAVVEAHRSNVGTSPTDKLANNPPDSIVS